VDCITHAAIEPGDEGSGVRICTCGEEPEPGGETDKKTEKTPEFEYKPDALIRIHVTIS
jgi:hypothetical protein